MSKFKKISKNALEDRPEWRSIIKENIEILYKPKNLFEKYNIYKTNPGKFLGLSSL